MCLWLTIFVILHKACPQRKLILLPLPSINSLWLCNQWVALLNFHHPHWHIDWCGLLQAPLLVRAHGCCITVIPRRRYLAAITLVLWFLRSCCSNFQNIPWALGTRILLVKVARHPQSYLFSAFWPTADLHYNLYLLTKEALMKGESYTYQWG